MRLIDEMKRQDAIDKAKKFNDFDVSKFKHLQLYEKFITELGILGYHFYTGRNSKILKVRSLTGPERLKVFAHIQIRDLLPSHDKCEQIQAIWDELYTLTRSSQNALRILRKLTLKNMN